MAAGVNGMLRQLTRWLKRQRWAGPFLRGLRTARGWGRQFVDLPVRQLAVAVQQLRAGPVDVLYLGNSTNLYVAPDESRSRRLQELIEAELGDRVTTARLVGPGYGAELGAELIRLLSGLEQRARVVVVAMAVRPSAAHIVWHPEYGYRRSIEILRGLDHPAGRLPYLSPRNRRTRADFERFHALPVATRWGRGRTIGEFQSALRGRRAAPDDLERQRTLFDYFHGERLTSDHPQLQYFAELGRQLREYGVPVVAYWAPIPVERGESYFPGEFAAHVESNLEMARTAFEQALGPLLHTVDAGVTRDDEFIDSRDGSEHWNLTGRLRVAALIADQVRAALGSLPSTIGRSDG